MYGGMWNNIVGPVSVAVTPGRIAQVAVRRAIADQLPSVSSRRSSVQASRGRSGATGTAEGVGRVARFRVRRFVSKADMKSIRKSGIKFDPARGNGIPTTTTNFTPRNQDDARRRTGAPFADYQIDIDATNIPRGETRYTKSGLPEYPLQGDVSPENIIEITAVPK